MPKYLSFPFPFYLSLQALHSYPCPKKLDSFPEREMLRSFPDHVWVAINLHHWKAMDRVSCHYCLVSSQWFSEPIWPPDSYPKRFLPKNDHK